MDPNGSQWILMDPVFLDGSQLIQKDPDLSCGISMYPDGSNWILMDPDGSWWILVDPGGSR